MAIRWRKNGTLLCAAQSEAEGDDTYINDRLHYQLTVISRALLPDPAHEVNARYHWVHGTDFLRGVPEIEILGHEPAQPLEETPKEYDQGFEDGQNKLKQEVWNGLLKGMKEGMNDDHKQTPEALEGDRELS